MTDRQISLKLSIDVHYRPIKHLPIIKNIPNELWDEINY